MAIKGGLNSPFFQGGVYDWWLSSGSSTPEPLGELFTDGFTSPAAAFSANWTTFGTNLPTVSGGKALFDNGSGTSNWTKGVRYSAYPTNLNKWTITVSSLILTAARSAASFGVGVGFYSVANRNTGQKGIGAYIDLSTGANTGKLVLGSLNNARAFTQLAISGSSLAYSTNDVLNYTLTQENDTLTFTVRNVTQSVELALSYTYTLDTGAGVGAFMHNRSNVCLFSLGNGISSVDSITYTSNEYAEVDYVFLGDSICQGYSANSVAARLPEQTFSGALASRSFVNLAGQSNKVEDYLSPQTEHLDYAVRKAYILQVGTNNKEHDTLASYQTGLQSIIDGIVATGDTVVICNLLPRNDGLDVRNFNSDLVTRYGAGGTYGTQFKIVDFFTAFRDAGTSTAFDANPAYLDDTVHPNAAGFVVQATALRNALIQFEAGNLS